MLLLENNNFIKRRYREQFSKLRFRSLCRKLWGILVGSPSKLIDLREIEDAVTVHARHHAGVQPVVIDDIVGSEGRCSDFDRAFRPLRSNSHERWLSIALAKEQDVALPVVELIQLSDLFFVRDGHHRISVAKLFGQKEMEAAITVWETECTTEDILALARSASRLTLAMTVIERTAQQVREEFKRVRELFDGDRPGGFSGGASGEGLPGRLSGLADAPWSYAQ